MYCFNIKTAANVLFCLGGGRFPYCASFQFFVLCFLFCLSSFCVLLPILSVSLDFPFLIDLSLFSDVYSENVQITDMKLFSYIKGCGKYLYFQSNLLERPPLLRNNLFYVTLIFISLHSAFLISIKPVLSNHLYNEPYLTLLLESHIRQV